MLPFSKSLLLAIFMLAPSTIGFAIGAMPVQTAEGLEAPSSPAPTEVPSMELVKAKMGKRAATNVCSEWTIPGGFGQPQCSSSQTCLFQTANGYFYEGCGVDGVAYDWVTQCFNYPQSGTPPVSEIYCPKSAPHCGYFGFVFTSGYTAYNFGCSTSSYGVAVQLVSSDSFFETATDNSTQATTTASGTASGYILPTRSASEAYIPPSVTITPTNTRTAPSSISTSPTSPIIGSHSIKVAIGLVVGVAVGGLVLLAILLGLLIWCCIRKRKQKKATLTQQQAATAFHDDHRISEIGGTGVEPFIGTSAPNGQEKIGPVVEAAEVYGNMQPMGQTYGAVGHSNGQVLPPTYQQELIPMQQYNELATPRNVSVPERPVSPMGPTPSKMPVSEMGSRPLQGIVPASGNQPIAEMSATVGSRVPRRPVGAPRPPPSEEMSDATINEGWKGHHELP